MGRYFDIVKDDEGNVDHYECNHCDYESESRGAMMKHHSEDVGDRCPGRNWGEEKEGEKTDFERPAGKERKRESLFPRPRTPHEVLEDVLEDFDVKPAFIDRLKKRSERQGGIHPTELQYYLDRLNSGVSSREEADFIAEEYQAALQRERDKAQEQGRPMSFPLKMGDPGPSRRRPMSRGLGDNQSRDYGGIQRGLDWNERDESDIYNRRGDRRPRRDYPKRRPVGEKEEESKYLTKDDLADILEKQQQQQKEKEKESKLVETLEGITSKLTELERKANEVPDGAVTKDELEKMKLEERSELLKQEAERYKEATDKQSKQIQQLIDELEEEREDKQEAINQALEKGFKKGRSQAGDFNEDGARLISQSIDGMKDLLETKEPLKEWRRAEEQREKTMEKRPQREQAEGAEEIEGIPEEYIIE